VLELAVAAFCSDVTPTVINHFDDFSDFHTAILHYFEPLYPDKLCAVAE
jgi:hypothetical protein